MDFEGVGSVIYRQDLNKIECREKRKGRAMSDFFAEYGAAGIRRGLNVIIRRIIPASEGDVHLEGFLADRHSLRFIEDIPGSLSMIVYPFKGEVKKYVLTERDFFSNAHKNPDPLIVKDLCGSGYVHIHPTDKDPIFFLPTHDWAPNMIGGALFFKRNPFLHPQDYDGFQEFMDYNPNKPRR